ncbi:MAG: phosphoribosylanthranilate isomerase [Pirellulales bacterium]
MFRIKICGIKNIDDACAAADAGADAVGLNFFSKSRRFIRKEAAQRIAADMPEGIMKVGVFVDHDARQILETVEQVGLDAVQLHGHEPPNLVAELPKHVPLIRAYRCGPEGLAPLVTYLGECRALGRLPDALLLDSDAGADFGGSGTLADWEMIASYRPALDLIGLPLILAGGLTPANVEAAIQAVRPDGVDVASGVENEPGRKARALVAQFVTAAQQAFRHNG